MRTSIASNWRPLLRALYAFLIAIVVLWAMPRKASAQLYVVGRDLNGTYEISTFDETTGEVIKAQLVTNLGYTRGILVFENSLYVADYYRGAVDIYDSGNGDLIERNYANFSPLNPTSLAFGGAMLVLDLKSSKYVGLKNNLFQSVFDYPGTIFDSGLAADTLTIWVAHHDDKSEVVRIGRIEIFDGPGLFHPDFITGVDDNLQLAVTNRGKLLVSLFSGGRVAAYAANTGALINANFITGLNHPHGLALSNNKLFVASFKDSPYTDIVGAYDADTGAVIKADLIASTAPIYAITAKRTIYDPP